MNNLAFGAKPAVLRCGRCGKFVDWEDARLQVVCGCRPHLELPPVARPRGHAGRPREGARAVPARLRPAPAGRLRRGDVARRRGGAGGGNRRARSPARWHGARSTARCTSSRWRPIRCGSAPASAGTGRRSRAAGPAPGAAARDRDDHQRQPPGAVLLPAPGIPHVGDPARFGRGAYAATSRRSDLRAFRFSTRFSWRRTSRTASDELGGRAPSARQMLTASRAPPSTSASVFRLFVTEKASNELAIDRASIRSTLLFTTPSSVTRPRSTMMWIGGLTIDAVAPEVRVPVDRPRDPEPQLVVELRDRQHVDLVVHLADAVELRHALLDVVALVRHRHLAGERDHAVVDLRVDAVEDREVRVSQHLLRHVAGRLQVLALPPPRPARSSRASRRPRQQTWRT